MSNKTPADSSASRRGARPARPAAPALPAMDELDHTHRRILASLSEMEALVEHLDAKGLDDAARSSAQAICQFFAGTARQHHAFEEATVFPALVRKGDKALIHHVLRLQQDHGWLEEDWLELEPQLQAVAGGYSWYALDALRAGVAVFSALYQEHIALEESMVYPEARTQLVAEASGRDDPAADGS